MAGLPWIVVFGILAFVANWRGWGMLFTVSVLCIGIALGQTAVGQGLYGGITTGIAATWNGVTSGLQAALR